MQGQIPTFLESLQLVPSQHQDLISQLESAQTVSCNTNFSGVGLACRGARASLGSESVATKPANQTEADAKWLVVISLYCEFSDAKRSDEGSNPAEKRRHASYFHNGLQRCPRRSTLSAISKQNSLSGAAATLQIPAGPVSITLVSLSICRG